MIKCCKNKLNFLTVANSTKYDESGRAIEKKVKCRVCGNIEKWFCVDLRTNAWIKS